MQENGKKMRVIRERLGLSTHEWGKALGYGGTGRSLDMQIRRFELGHRKIPRQTYRLMLMFEAYGVPPKWKGKDNG